MIDLSRVFVGHPVPSCRCGGWVPEADTKGGPRLLTMPLSARLEPAFADLLTDVDLCERRPESICALWPDLTIAYFNPAWVTFALNNDGAAVLERSGLGTNLMSVVPPVLQELYADLYAAALEPNRLPPHHGYECSSPDVFRVFDATLHSLRGQGILAVHSLVVARPIEHLSEQPHRASYVDARGTVLQCSNCRRTNRRSDPAHWDWVPAWVATPPADTSHGICPVCFEVYYRAFVDP